VDGVRANAYRSFRISPVDSSAFERRNKPYVLDADEEVGTPRDRALPKRELMDQRVAADLLEKLRATVSRASRSEKAPHSECWFETPSYLFLAFYPARKQEQSASCSWRTPVQVRLEGSQQLNDPEEALELKILVDELLTRCGP